MRVYFSTSFHAVKVSAIRTIAFSGDVVLWIAFDKLPTGVEEEKLTSSLFGLRLVEHDDDTWRGGIVEKIFRQVDDAFDQVPFDKPFANVFFFVRIRVAGTARGGAGVEYHGGACLVIHARKDVLHPAPVRLVTGVTRAFGEAVKLVGVVVLFLELILIPHGIGDHAVESLKTIALAKLGLAEGVADLDFAFHVMDDHIHVRHRPCAGLVFLAIEFRGREGLAGAQIHLFLQNQLDT